MVINVQGDEPFIRPEQIEKLKAVFENNPSADIATLAMRFDATRSSVSIPIVENSVSPILIPKPF